MHRLTRCRGAPRARPGACSGKRLPQAEWPASTRPRHAPRAHAIVPKVVSGWRKPVYIRRRVASHSVALCSSMAVTGRHHVAGGAPLSLTSAGLWRPAGWRRRSSAPYSGRRPRRLEDERSATVRCPHSMREQSTSELARRKEEEGCQCELDHLRVPACFKPIPVVLSGRPSIPSLSPKRSK